MIRFLILLAIVSVASPAQQTKPSQEEQDLGRAMGEAGSSPTEMIRALERHLAKYPKSARRGEIERALVKAAIDARDTARTLQYGEKHLAVEPGDLLVLERVTRLLVASDNKADNEKGLKFAKLFVAGMRQLETERPANGRMDAQLREDLDRGLGRGYTFQARAQGSLGNFEDAVAAARKAFEIYPSAEPAREVARWLLKQNKVSDALPHLADAFSLPDPRLTEEDRLQIRRQMGELYAKLHSSEKGMGDILLAAYDRSVDLQHARKERLRSIDPNAHQSDPMQYTVSGVNGEKLELKSLAGKVVVLDFWATWCGPCRIQYPMYEQIKQSFKNRDDIVFLGINTDEEREKVKPFLQEQKWNKAVYFDDGLSSLLKVQSIPTTMVFDRKGQLHARLNGFVPDRFIDMLTERIKEALAQ